MKLIIVFLLCQHLSAFATEFDCDRFLSRTGAPLPRPEQLRAKSLQFTSFLRTHFVQPQGEPALVNLRQNTLVDLPRAAELAAQLQDPQSDLNREMGRIVATLGGMQSQSLWDEYFKSYDKIVGFMEGFLDIAGMIDAVMPREGVIADFGSGTGNILTYLALDQRQRQLIGIDFSTQGHLLARSKTRSLGVWADLRHGDLADEQLPPDSLDGATMVNVLYTLGENRLKVLQGIHRALKPGAPFILSDIVDVVVKDRQKMAQYFTAAVMQALMAQAPISEFDLALVGKINLMTLLNPVNQYLSPEELTDLIRQAGFKVKAFHMAYYGSASFFYLCK